MRTALQIFNGFLIVIVLMTALQAVLSDREADASYATALGTFIGSVLWLVAPVLTFFAARENATARNRRIAFRANILQGMLMAVLLMTFLYEAFWALLLASSPYILNIVGLRRLSKQALASVHLELVPDDCARGSSGSSHLGEQPQLVEEPFSTASQDPARLTSVDEAPSTLAREEPGLPPAKPREANRRTSRSNYLVRHWRGELSLPVSYWVNGVLLGGVLALFDAGVALAFEGASIRTSAIVYVMLVTSAIAFSIWSIIGIWRSAWAHPARGGRRIWAITAEVMMALSSLTLVSTLFNNFLPQLKEMVPLAFGHDPMGRLETTVSTDGKTLILHGVFAAGSAENVRRILDAAPGVETVMLDSRGGRTGEAEKVARLVRDRKLNTYVEGKCESACTYVFLAGVDRAATPNARIGFHRPHFPGLEGEHLQQITRDSLEFYRKAGIPQAFVDRIASTSPESMWYPTSDELLEAGIVNRVSLGGETTAAWTLVFRSKKDLARAFRAHELFQAYEARFPGTIDQVVEAAFDASEHGYTDADVAAAARAIIARDTYKIAALTDDESLDELLEIMRDQVAAARAVSDEACARLLVSKLNVVQVLPQGAGRAGAGVDGTSAAFGAPGSSGDH